MEETASDTNRQQIKTIFMLFLRLINCIEENWLEQLSKLFNCETINEVILVDIEVIRLSRSIFIEN
jgi:hypothetical protein